MNEQSGYASVRMLISSMFEGLANRNSMNDICFERKIIRYRGESEIRALRGGVILIKEPLVELITDETLVEMGFGC